jgi:hypothetical protein
MKYRLRGIAKVLNWLLAACLAASCIASVVMLREHPAFAAGVCALQAMLLVGVLRPSPLAYVGIATLSFFGVAAALDRTDLVLGAANLLAMLAALFVRDRLVLEREVTEP